MPILQKVATQPVVLPATGITCHIALTWGEKKQIENFWTKDIKISVGSSGAEKSGSLDGSMLEEQNKLALQLAVKSWDAEETAGVPLPLTVENMMLLPSEDGAVLQSAINALLGYTNEEETKKD